MILQRSSTIACGGRQPHHHASHCFAQCYCTGSNTLQANVATSRFQSRTQSYVDTKQAARSVLIIDVYKPIKQSLTSVPSPPCVEFQNRNPGIAYSVNTHIFPMLFATTRACVMAWSWVLGWQHSWVVPGDSLLLRCGRFGQHLPMEAS